MCGQPRCQSLPAGASLLLVRVPVFGRHRLQRCEKRRVGQLELDPVVVRLTKQLALDVVALALEPGADLLPNIQVISTARVPAACARALLFVCRVSEVTAL